MQSKTISRVMSCVIIYPMELSPVPLSDPPENMTGSHIRFLFGLASDGVYMAFSVTRETVVSYTAFPPLPEKPGGISLLHYPWSRLRRTLSGILPCEARTFLTWPLSVLPAAITYLTLSKTEHQTVNNHTTNSLLVHPQIADPTKPYKTAFHTSKQLPPTNSRRIEFLGISSIGTPTK